MMRGVSMILALSGALAIRMDGDDNRRDRVLPSPQDSKRQKTSAEGDDYDEQARLSKEMERTSSAELLSNPELCQKCVIHSHFSYEM